MNSTASAAAPVTKVTARSGMVHFGSRSPVAGFVNTECGAGPRYGIDGRAAKDDAVVACKRCLAMDLSV